MKALPIAAAGLLTTALAITPGVIRVANAADINCPSPSSSLTQVGSVYQVTSPADLQLLKTSIPSLSASYQQTGNIDMGGCTWDRGINGTFSGTYDGGGFQISGLQVTSEFYPNVGLFEYVTGTIKRVGFTGSVSSTRTDTSTRYVGGLVGYLYIGGRIENSYTTGNVSDSGTSTGTKTVGGLVGRMFTASVENSYASGAVTSQSTDANSGATGGLVGSARSNSSIIGSHATGAVSAKGTAGGLLGRAEQGTSPDVTIERSYATGNVEATASLASAGGLVGVLVNGVVSNSYATGNVSGIADTQHLGGLFAGMESSSATDVFASGGVSGWTQSVTTYGQVGGLVGDGTGGNNTFVRAYSATITGMSPSSGNNYDLVGGVAGIVATTTWDSVAWNSTTAPNVLNPIGSTASVTGVSSYTTSALNDINTFTDPTGLDWNTGGTQTIAEGYDANYTWGICSAVNDGYPFLTAFYTSDPCSGGGDGPAATSPQPTYTFSFLTSGGGTCLPTVTVRRFEHYTLPPAVVACTPLGTSMVGWSIPGQDWAFAPGRVVTVVDNQVFTAMAREPEITIVYDANVNMTDPCIANDINIENETDRNEAAQTPRTGTEATLATSAPCAPPGFDLIGWTDANTPDGSGQAQSGAQTYEPGAAIPDVWNLDTPNPINTMRLFALWGRPGS